MLNRRIARDEYTYKGRKVLLSTVEIMPGYFETALLDTLTFMDYASKDASTEEQARANHAEILKNYPADKPKIPTTRKAPAPLSGKYAKLRDDLKIALEAGRKAQAEDPEDGGSCNFDSPLLYLPRWKEADIERAAREAGTRVFSYKRFGSKAYVFIPNSGAQGNARSRNAEAMYECLKGMGYEASMYYQMD